MANWLIKTEPSDFSYDDLVRAKRATWDGVANATALIHLRKMKKGDQALVYHTGNEKAVVAIAEIITNAYPDPKAGDPKIVVVDLKPKEKLKHPVSLKQIKADSVFADWELVKIGRLSVMPVPSTIWKKIIELSETKSS